MGLRDEGFRIQEQGVLYGLKISRAFVGPSEGRAVCLCVEIYRRV